MAGPAVFLCRKHKPYLELERHAYFQALIPDLMNQTVKWAGAPKSVDYHLPSDCDACMLKFENTLARMKMGCGGGG